MTTANAHIKNVETAQRLPRLGFVGTGWIGRLRMEALLEDNNADFCAVHDPSREAAEAAAAIKPGTAVTESFDELLNSDIDGVVIATPSALHAEQCLKALAKGKAVFCQKPLARTHEETSRVVEAARKADRLLSVDFSYRYLAGVGELRNMIQAGELGEIFAADLVFHNAYGPDKSWFYDVKSSGGGCVMDLGIHMVDLAMWLLDSTEVSRISSTLCHEGKKLTPPYDVVEDYAVAEFDVAKTRARLCCSWNLNAGQDAVIEVRLYGTQGGAAISNVGGSFFDFEVHHFQGTDRHQLAGYPDEWGCRALSDWVNKLAQSSAFDPSVEQVVRVADVIDRIYKR
jgi:predicted dehydrogenase